MPDTYGYPSYRQGSDIPRFNPLGSLRGVDPGLEAIQALGAQAQAQKQGRISRFFSTLGQSIGGAARAAAPNVPNALMALAAGLGPKENVPTIMNIIEAQRARKEQEQTLSQLGGVGARFGLNPQQTQALFKIGAGEKLIGGLSPLERLELEQARAVNRESLEESKQRSAMDRLTRTIDSADRRNAYKIRVEESLRQQAVIAKTENERARLQSKFIMESEKLRNNGDDESADLLLEAGTAIGRTGKFSPVIEEVNPGLANYLRRLINIKPTTKKTFSPTSQSQGTTITAQDVLNKYQVRK